MAGGGMADWFVQTCRALIPGIVIPDVVVETGTYRGDNIPSKIGVFREVHSIELDPAYARAARALYTHPSVTVHQGDSGDVLDTLVDTWHEPVMFFLNAHWSGGDTARAPDSQTPLLKEMRALSRRTEHRDIIFVDDTRSLGRKCFSGTPGCKDWPYTKFDWREVTMTALLAAYGLHGHPRPHTHLARVEH